MDILEFRETLVSTLEAVDFGFDVSVLRNRAPVDAIPYVRVAGGGGETVRESFGNRARSYEQTLIQMVEIGTGRMMSTVEDAEEVVFGMLGKVAIACQGITGPTISHVVPGSWQEAVSWGEGSGQQMVLVLEVIAVGRGSELWGQAAP